MESSSIEQEIVNKGLTAPRITPSDIEANIVSEHYFTAEEGNFGHQYLRTINENGGVVDHEARANNAAAASLPLPELRYHEARTNNPAPLNLLTFCVLVLRNGFTVTGESACAIPEYFDAEAGRKMARQNAVFKVWPLMVYELKSKIASITK